MFELIADEILVLVSQSAIPSRKQLGGGTPLAFTEPGVAMRRFLVSNAYFFQRLDSLELRQTQTDQKVERVLNAIEKKSVIPKQAQDMRMSD